MPNFGMAEQYGIGCEDQSEGAWADREKGDCPFLGGRCAKSGGVCSITDGETVAIVCPHRFRENDLLFRSVARVAFGTEKDCVAIKEVPFLTGEAGHAVGNIDNVIARFEAGKMVDWCALEIQAVYFSGRSMGPEIQHFESERSIPEPASRRPDYRSSGPKRLLPQLETKVPALRRWGKRMFVAVDRGFFAWMPTIDRVAHISNADVCWTVFDLERTGVRYRLTLTDTVLTTLEGSRKGLVGGVPTTQPEFESQVVQNSNRTDKVVWRS